MELLKYVQKMQDILYERITNRDELSAVLLSNIETMDELDPRIGEYLKKYYSPIYSLLMAEIIEKGFITYETLLLTIEKNLISHFGNKV